ncbi:hypothetical protein J6590_035487 [Homalodisca vitripennis]|nr:hypothetical protein J6590_035487 [Homalodisca vitripennis]
MSSESVSLPLELFLSFAVRRASKTCPVGLPQDPYCGISKLANRLRCSRVHTYPTGTHTKIVITMTPPLITSFDDSGFRQTCSREHVRAVSNAVSAQSCTDTVKCDIVVLAIQTKPIVLAVCLCDQAFEVVVCQPKIEVKGAVVRLVDVQRMTCLANTVFTYLRILS